MKKITKPISHFTCGFTETYLVSSIEFTFHKKSILKELERCWRYLKNKPNQTIQIPMDPSDLDFSSDDEDFNCEIYKVTIIVNRNESIYLECLDGCCSKCWSKIILKEEIYNLF
jgi:hypothetical protein